MASTKVELNCEMTCGRCREKIENTLKDVSGLKVNSIDVANQRVLLEMADTCVATIMDIQNQIENRTGIKTVVKGVGDQFTGVSEIFGPSNLVGVVRMAQIPMNKCFVDGIVDNVNLSRNDSHCSLNIHEYGDLRGEKFEFVGPIRQSIIDNVKPVQGRCTFRCYVNDCNLVDMIGRSMVLTEQETNNHLGAGIMARSSPIFGNVKKVCECSGKTLWDEREERQKK
ncbi:copper chaperone for superoxide dismutase-like [Brevipalpus obovatus]|uniref:copper chaperone for superoxide dismutase-like n=1 Tax=Brevipalpus obovatus TaxID=246614 RepID=UPI003D9F97D8